MEDYIGTIKQFGYFRYDLSGWIICHGQTIDIREYDALFALLSTTFGGDGMNNFNLPDLRKKDSFGNYYSVGQIMENGLPYLESYICFIGIYPSSY